MDLGSIQVHAPDKSVFRVLGRHSRRRVGVELGENQCPFCTCVAEIEIHSGNEVTVISVKISEDIFCFHHIT
jgi:hypothetical protein